MPPDLDEDRFIGVVGSPVDVFEPRYCLRVGRESLCFQMQYAAGFVDVGRLDDGAGPDSPLAEHDLLDVDVAGVRLEPQSGDGVVVRVDVAADIAAVGEVALDDQVGGVDVVGEDRTGPAVFAATACLDGGAPAVIAGQEHTVVACGPGPRTSCTG